MSPDARDSSVPVVTLVTATGCHFCEDAHTTLRSLVDDGAPLRLVTIAADSAQGRDLIARHRPAMNPLVLVDGEFFSAGRLPRKKLTKALHSRRVPAVGA